MELLQLKYFKDAAELENFSKAAQKNSKNSKKTNKVLTKKNII